MLTALATGVLLGLSAGVSPGPLLALVIAQTMRHGVREGCKVAAAPLLTDLPIILLTLLAARQLAGLRPALGCVSLAGGAFVLHLAWKCFRVTHLPVAGIERPPQSWRDGIVGNLLNPNPYLFWFSVGAPTLAQAMQTGAGAVAGFLGGFYLLLVGSKVVLAVAVGRSRAWMTGGLYRSVLRVLGLLMAGFALRMFWDALRYFRAAI